MLHLDQFFNYSPDPMCIITKKGEFRMLNPAFCKLLQYNENEIQNKPVFNFIHPDDHDFTAEKIQKNYIGNTSESQEFENRFISASGQVIYLIWKTCFVCENDLLYAIAHDNTETRKNLHETEDLRNKFLRIIDMVPHPIFLKDSKGRFVLVNEAQANLYSRTKMELLGKDDDDFIYLEDELSVIKESDSRVLDKRVTVKLPEQILTYKHGGIKVLHTIKVPFVNRENEVNILGVSIDLSELKEAENELKRINFELDNFVYHASHDIKAPLCSLMGLLKLMEIEKDPLMKEVCIAEAKKSIARLSDFIKDLIDYSRNNRTNLHSSRIDFEQMINDCLNNLRYMEGLGRMKRIIKIQDSLDFWSDEVRIRTILMNCISNAIKYQDILKEDSVLSIKISQKEHNTCITISDNGIGIEESNQKKIFDMFFRATEKSSGSGLGLYIVRQVVEKLKGTLFVHSKKGKGTIFTVILPDLREVETRLKEFVM
jgi:PAS domain S-box-containing protein